MSIGTIKTSNGSLKMGYIYEGERVGIKMPDGKICEIPGIKVNEVLLPATLPSGEGCHLLQEFSPMSRFPIVVLTE